MHRPRYGAAVIIFIDSQNYQNFFERLENISTDSSTSCYAWALATNHAHLFAYNNGYGPRICDYAAAIDRICSAV